MRDQPPSVPETSRDEPIESIDPREPPTDPVPATAGDTGASGDGVPAGDGAVRLGDGAVRLGDDAVPPGRSPVEPDPEPAGDVVGPHGPGEETGAEVQPSREGHASGVALLKETVVILASALVLSLIIKTFFFQAFFIPSASMRDTLIEGDRVLVTKLAPGPFDLSRGDAVVFKDPGGWLPPVVPAEQSALRDRVTSVLTYVGLLPQDSGEHLIKRIIGLPGDRVASDGEGGPVTVNGVAITEPYLRPSSVPSEVSFDVVVPEGSVWVMGDNRQNSQDSRYHLGEPGGGAVPVDNVVGVAFVTVWPLDRATLLRNPGDTFEAVPDAA